MYFSFKILNHLPLPPFHVCALRSQNLSIGHHYRITLHGWFTNWVSTNDLLGQAACLTIQQAKTTNYYHGYVAHLILKAKLQMGWLYVLTLVSPWYLLTRQQHHRTWVDISLLTVITDLLQVYEGTRITPHITPQASTIVHSFVCQYGERDYSFLQRLLFNARLVSYFEQYAEEVKLHIKRSWTEQSVKFFSVGNDTALLANESRLYHFTEQFRWDPKTDTQQQNATAWMYHEAVTLGDRIQVRGKVYRVFGVQLIGQQGDLLAQSAGVSLRLKLSLWPQRVMYPYYVLKQASYPYLLTGTVVHAHWDKTQQQGVYRVRYHFDENQCISPRLAQGEWDAPGCHIALTVGSEVVLSCLTGGWDQVFIIGPLASSSQPTPVTCLNWQQGIKRQWGHEWSWQDQQDNAYMQWMCGDQSLSLRQHDPHQGIRFSSGKAGIAISTDDSLQHQATGKIAINSQDSITLAAKDDFQLNVINETIEILSAQAILIEAHRSELFAKHKAEFNAANIQLTANGQFCLKSQMRQHYQSKKISVESQEGLSMKAGQQQLWRVVNTQMHLGHRKLLLKAHSVRFRATVIIIDLEYGAKHS